MVLLVQAQVVLVLILLWLKRTSEALEALLQPLDLHRRVHFLQAIDLENGWLLQQRVVLLILDEFRLHLLDARVVEA